jgi:molybdopterin/thiamine biosynthesis adenylyltransferase
MANPTASPSTTTPGRVVLRFLGATFSVLRDHLTADPDREQFAFLLTRPVETADGLLMLVQDVFLPGPGDLLVQSAGRVEPHPDFQALVYLVAQQKGLAIIDVHTHLADVPPSFSALDRGVAQANAAYTADRFRPPVTLGLVVFNRDVTAHDALLFDRERGEFEPVSELQIVGPGLDIRPIRAPSDRREPDERYARQQLVPGWKQGALANRPIGIVGVGGHGAQVLQTLVSIGAGATGWIAGIDPDRVESSNLPRLPYAIPDDVGKTKANVAAEFVRRKNPAATFFPYSSSVTDPAALARLRGCDVLFGCGDNDGVRLVLNDLAVRFGIPFIDLGADIRVANDVVEAGGQVRVVVPGTTACLACCGAFDPGQAALDLLGDDDRAVYTQRGYVIGADAGPTPSVAVLNALIAQYAVTALLSLIGSGPFKRWDYLHLDWSTGRTLVAASARDPACPVCGDKGVLFSGADISPASDGREPSWQPVDGEGDRSLERSPSPHRE